MYFYLPAIAWILVDWKTAPLLSVAPELNTLWRLRRFWVSLALNPYQFNWQWFSWSQTLFFNVFFYCPTCFSTQVRYRRSMTRPFVNNWLVNATPPTVFGHSFWNFTDVLAMAYRCAYCLLIILRFFFSTFSALLTYRINPPIRRGFFPKKKPPKIQTRLIIEVFGHIGIFGKVRWCHVVTENADLRNW